VAGAPPGGPGPGDRLARCRSDLDQRRAEADAAAATLAGALQAVGVAVRTTGGSATLASLVDQAEHWESAPPRPR